MMAKRGRKPKPTELKRLTGNPGKRKLPKNEIKPKGEKIRVPTGLPFDEARKLHKKINDALGETGLLTGVDGPALALMSVHYAVAFKAAKRLEAEGLTVDNARGDSVKNPNVTILNQNSLAFRRYASEFGMTPSSRAGLAAPETGEQLSLADALFQVVDNMKEDH